MGQLPPGQQAISSFPRFGLPQYATRVVAADQELRVENGGSVESAGLITADTLKELTRVDQTSDFHCVTTWSKLEAKWSGYRFVEIYEQVIKPLLRPNEQPRCVLFRTWDGYRTALMLEDLLADEVLLADRLDGEPLGSAHGAPMRLVAPKHYGYKNPKHIKRMDFLPEAPEPRSLLSRFIDHPRARVALEERGAAPGWLLRHLYRLRIDATMRQFEQGLQSEKN